MNSDPCFQLSEGPAADELPAIASTSPLGGEAARMSFSSFECAADDLHLDAGVFEELDSLWDSEFVTGRLEVHPVAGDASHAQSADSHQPDPTISAVHPAANEEAAAAGFASQGREHPELRFIEGTPLESSPSLLSYSWHSTRTPAEGSGLSTTDSLRGPQGTLTQTCPNTTGSSNETQFTSSRIVPTRASLDKPSYMTMAPSPSLLQCDAMSGFLWEKGKGLGSFSSKHPGQTGDMNLGTIGIPAQSSGNSADSGIFSQVQLSSSGMTISGDTASGGSGGAHGVSEDLSAACSTFREPSEERYHVVPSPEYNVNSGQQLVLATCPPGCRCPACDMALFDWVTLEQQPSNASLSDGFLSPPKKKRQGVTGDDLGFSQIDSNVFLPHQSLEQAAAMDTGSHQTPQDNYATSSAVLSITQDPSPSSDSRSLVLRRGPLSESSRNNRAGGNQEEASQEGAVVVSTAPRARPDMTGRLAGVIKQIKNKQSDGDWLDRLVKSDLKHQAGGVFRRSKVEELEITPAGKAALGIPGVAGVSMPGGTSGSFQASSLPGLTSPQTSTRPKRIRPSRAKPAADGTMRPKPERLPRVALAEPKGLRYVGRTPALPADELVLVESCISLEEVKQQLVLLAEASAAREEGQAKRLMRQLQVHASDRGTPAQRVAHYFLDALRARSDGSGTEKYNMAMQVSQQEMAEAMERCFSVLPHVDFMHLCAMGTILEHVTDPPGGVAYKRVHILSLGIWMGQQWVHLFHQLASLPGGAPHLHVTGIDISCENEVTESKASASFVGRLLAKVAMQFGVPFTYTGLGATMTSFKPALFETQEGEGLFVNINIGALFFPDDTVIRWNPRDTCLRWIRDLRPVCVVMNEIDADFNSTFFLPRFKEAVRFFSSVFESLDAVLPRSSPHRHNCERLYFARDILNIVACEGLARTVRAERLESWQRRLERLGFLRLPFSEQTFAAIQNRTCGHSPSPAPHPSEGGQQAPSWKLQQAGSPASSGEVPASVSVDSPSQGSFQPDFSAAAGFSDLDLTAQMSSLEELLGLTEDSSLRPSAGSEEKTPSGVPLEPSFESLLSPGSSCTAGISQVDNMPAGMPQVDKITASFWNTPGNRGLDTAAGSVLSNFLKDAGAVKTEPNVVGGIDPSMYSRLRDLANANLPGTLNMENVSAKFSLPGNLSDLARNLDSGTTFTTAMPGKAVSEFLNSASLMDGVSTLKDGGGKKRGREAGARGEGGRGGGQNGEDGFRVIEYGGGARLVWKGSPVLASSAWRAYV